MPLAGQKTADAPGSEAPAVSQSVLVEGIQIVGGGLVDIVVEPVGVDQLAGGAPPDDGRLGGVITREIVQGDMNVLSLLYIPLVFQGQGVPVIFQMAQEEELPAVLGFYSKNTGFLRDCQDFQVGNFRISSSQTSV